MKVTHTAKRFQLSDQLEPVQQHKLTADEPIQPARPLTLKVQVDGRLVVMIRGRAAWALVQLIDAGAAGCSYIDSPAPHWPGYIHQLRNIGVVIDSIREAHRGPFPGHHCRYYLISPVVILETSNSK